MSRVRFETPEDVHLDFELAGPASRLAAAFLDYLVIGAIAIAVLAVMTAGGIIALRFRDLLDPEAFFELSGFSIGLAIGTLFALNLGYFVLCEWLFGGQTLGKRLLGLRVVRDGGYAIDFGSSFVRNVMRAVDMLPFFYLVGLVAVVLSNEKKRLGDHAAGTIVVRHDRAPLPKARFAGETYAALSDKVYNFNRDHIAPLGPDTLEILDSYYDRRELVSEAYRAELLRAVVEQIALRMSLPLQGPETHERFVKEVYLALREKLAR